MANTKRKWQTYQALWKLPLVLVIDAVSFSYTEEDGIIFEETEDYVERLKDRLTTCYGVASVPTITPYLG